MLCIVRQRFLCRSDHLSRGDLPSFVSPTCVNSKLVRGGSDPELGRRTTWRKENSQRISDPIFTRTTDDINNDIQQDVYPVFTEVYWLCVVSSFEWDMPCMKMTIVFPTYIVILIFWSLKFVKVLSKNSIAMLLNPLNPELNPICYLLAKSAHHFLHVSRIRVKSLTSRLLMFYIYAYGAPILDVSRSHTTTQHSR